MTKELIARRRYDSIHERLRAAIAALETIYQMVDRPDIGDAGWHPKLVHNIRETARMANSGGTQLMKRKLIELLAIGLFLAACMWTGHAELWAVKIVGTLFILSLLGIIVAEYRRPK